jgi:hypothetical protein
MAVFVKRLCTAMSYQRRVISWLGERKLTSHGHGISDLVNICITLLVLVIEHYTHVHTEMCISKTCDVISCRCHLRIIPQLHCCLGNFYFDEKGAEMTWLLLK